MTGATTPDTATLISVAVGTVLPWLTGRATRITTHPAVRGALLLVLAGATSVLTELGTVIAAGGTYNLWDVLLNAAWTYALGVALHTGIYRHTDAYQRNAATGGVIGPIPVSNPEKP